MAARLRQVLRLPGRVPGRAQIVEGDVDVLYPDGRLPGKAPGRISASKRRKEVERKPQPVETIGLIRCTSLPEARTGDRQPKEERGRQARREGKGAAASVQTITKEWLG